MFGVAMSKRKLQDVTTTSNRKVKKKEDVTVSGGVNTCLQVMFARRLSKMPQKKVEQQKQSKPERKMPPKKVAQQKQSEPEQTRQKRKHKGKVKKKVRWKKYPDFIRSSNDSDFQECKLFSHAHTHVHSHIPYIHLVEVSSPPVSPIAAKPAFVFSDSDSDFEASKFR